MPYWAAAQLQPQRSPWDAVPPLSGYRVYAPDFVSLPDLHGREVEHRPFCFPIRSSSDRSAMAHGTVVSGVTRMVMAGGDARVCPR